MHIEKHHNLLNFSLIKSTSIYCDMDEHHDLNGGS